MPEEDAVPEGQDGPTNGDGPPHADDPLFRRLEPFFKLNPLSRFEMRKDFRVVVQPWGDDTIEFRLGEDSIELIEALNQVYLPPTLTALWHLDTRELEVIYTAYPVESELKERSFDFALHNIELKCRFGSSSTRLLALAEAHWPVGPSPQTAHRNLESFDYFARAREHEPDSWIAQEGEPLSFWISGLEWDDDKVAELLRHLNFFMHYFDRQTPRILVHEEQGTRDTAQRPRRYPTGEFPPSIAGRSLEPYLMGLWESATDAGDPFREFLYSYQILEYVAFYYLQRESLESIKRIIKAPDIVSRPSDAADRILEVVITARMSDEAKIVAAMKELGEPDALWREIEPNAELFSRDVTFDGGFVLASLLKPGWGRDDFRASWIPSFPDALRRIRNALVHARESRMVGVIAPTAANYNRLRPWLSPLSSAVMQAMLYRE